jgi:hypothetical protein
MDSSRCEFFAGASFTDQDHRTTHAGNTCDLLLEPEKNFAGTERFSRAGRRRKKPIHGHIYHYSVILTKKQEKQ